MARYKKRPKDVSQQSKEEGNAACSSPGCGCGVDRRQFLKVAGSGAAALLSSGTGGSAMSASSDNAKSAIDHFVPEDKKLDPKWMRGLFDRGKPQVYSGKDLTTIGMPVGGIATGQLYLRGDGTLACWQLFNGRNFTGYGRENYRTYTPESPVEQGFAVTVETDDKTLARPLNKEGFPGVEFLGEYPIGLVRYQNKDFPVAVEMEVFSPFIPLNAKDSALPATLFHLTVENVSQKKVSANILAWLENPVCLHSAAEINALRRSEIRSEKWRTLLVHTATAAPEDAKRPKRPKIVLADFEGDDYGDWKVEGEAFGKKPAQGTLPNQQQVSGFEGQGLVNTFLGGDKPQGKLTSPPFTISRKFLNFLIGGGKHEGRTCINLLVEGKPVRTAVGREEERLQWRGWNVEEFEGQEARIEIVDRHSGAWGHINVDSIELSDEHRAGAGGPIEKLEDCGSMVLALAGRDASRRASRKILAAAGDLAEELENEKEIVFPVSQRRKSALLTPQVKLDPGEKRSFTFVLAWHFPNHQNGHEYANRFDDAVEVAHYVFKNHKRLAADTRTWHDTYYDSTIPRWLLDRLHSTVSYLATGTAQWWKNGRFWCWEGVGCCHGTCTHVWNYAHATARLFPELERSARTNQDLGSAFHKDGLVGFRGERNGQYAADGQCGTVLKCYREHQMSSDDKFLKDNWERIKQVLLYSIGRDGNDDGLIEDSQHNTFDINFEGPNTFVGSLYLAALRAGEEMAAEVGDKEFARRCRQIFESGRGLSLERLWNGEYFIQIVDLKKHPKHQYADGCISDQVFGQGWAHHVGLGYVYPEEHNRKALESVWKYNWAPDVGPQNKAHLPERWFISPGEAGLFICTWPKSKHLGPESVRYRDEVWTGIEYQVAGHMVWEGVIEEALAICRVIHDRYHPSRHNPWNEVECGDHYARALASWGVFTALAGYEYHGPKRHLGFAPRMSDENFRTAFTAAEGWGTFTQKRKGRKQYERIEVRWGRLRLETLAFAVDEKVRGPRTVVRVGGKEVEASCSVEDGRLLIKLSKGTTLKEGDSLEVEIG